MVDFWTYINTDEFMLYGSFVYLFVLPGLVLLLVYIIMFIFDYSDFREFKKKKDVKDRILMLKNELKALEKQSKMEDDL